MLSRIEDFISENPGLKSEVDQEEIFPHSWKVLDFEKEFGFRSHNVQTVSRRRSSSAMTWPVLEAATVLKLSRISYVNSHFQRRKNMTVRPKSLK